MLNRPRYELYVGRRCCHLSLPLAATVVEADTLAGVLAAYRPAYQDVTDPADLTFGIPNFDELFAVNGPGVVRWDDGFPGAPESERAVERMDRIVDAAGPVRRFATRIEHQAAWQGDAA